MAKVLVIEDNPGVRSVASRALRSSGYDVIEAEDGRSGVEAVVRDKPDLAITDIFMPEQEGIETIKRIREVAPRLPIIVISGLSRWGDYVPLDEALAVGANVALEKPFSLDSLLSAVKKLLPVAQ